jgi:catechol 2,3-dioxygenase-like lactoylglutathione lyase family enzyme
VKYLNTTTPVFLVADVAATMEWYRAKLGFSGSAVPASPPHNFGILNRDGVEIMLQRLDGYEKPHLYRRREGGVWDVYVRVDGVRELHDEFSAAGVTVLEPLRLQPYGQRELVIRDLNGYVLVFAEAIP